MAVVQFTDSKGQTPVKTTAATRRAVADARPLVPALAQPVAATRHTRRPQHITARQFSGPLAFDTDMLLLSLTMGASAARMRQSGCDGDPACNDGWPIIPPMVARAASASELRA